MLNKEYYECIDCSVCTHRYLCCWDSDKFDVEKTIHFLEEEISFLKRDIEHFYYWRYYGHDTGLDIDDAKARMERYELDLKDQKEYFRNAMVRKMSDEFERLNSRIKRTNEKIEKLQRKRLEYEKEKRKLISRLPEENTRIDRLYYRMTSDLIMDINTNGIREDIADLVDEGYSDEEIAKQIGETIDSIYDYTFEKLSEWKYGT